MRYQQSGPSAGFESCGFSLSSTQSVDWPDEVTKRVSLVLLGLVFGVSHVCLWVFVFSIGCCRFGLSVP